MNKGFRRPTLDRIGNLNANQRRDRKNVGSSRTQPLQGTGLIRARGQVDMRIAKATGPNAGVIKYDLLTALGVHGCAQSKAMQKLVLRFITLIVARYNWTTDRLTVGQREIAAMWSVDERSVKREMAKIRALGWLEQTRPAARGRVAEYSLGLDAILACTRNDWSRVGPDFETRLAGPDAVPPASPNANIIAFPGAMIGQGLWTRVQSMLHGQDPHLYRAWFAVITADGPEEGVLRLYAPSRFHATYLSANHGDLILRLARSLDPALQRIEVGFTG